MPDAEPRDSIRCAGGDQGDRSKMAEMREGARCQRDRRLRPGPPVQSAVGTHDMERNVEQFYRRLGSAAHRIELIRSIERRVEAMDHHYRRDRDGGFACQAKAMPYYGEGRV